MNVRSAAPLLAIGIALGMGAQVTSLSAQATARNGGGWEMPRTPDGRPDLQGNWTNATLTPFERPRDVGATMSRQEAEEMERGFLQTREARVTAVSDPDRPPPPTGGDGSTGAAGGVGGYNTVYIESGDRVAVIDGEARTSLVVDPPDGRVPPIKPEARERQMAARQNVAGMGQYDNPENRPLGERCILSFGSNAGPPMLPNGFYNNNYTIVQTPDHVVILTEMIHDARIIRIGDGPRLPNDVRPYFGDSWGRWVGDTLVVETTNFHPQQQYRGVPSDNLKVTEKFTLMDEETIYYRFTVEDPTTYEQPWSGEVPFRKLDAQIYEYACHEGNYSLSNVLSGARYQERQAAENQP